MSLDTIRDAIVKASEKEASQIVNAARKQADELIASRKEALAEESELLFQGKARAIEEHYNRQVIQFQGRAGKKVLERRNALLRRLFAEARREILAWPYEQYLDAMRRLVTKVTEGSPGRLRVHPEDAGLFKELIQGLNASRPEGAKLEIDDSSALAVRGGFIFVGRGFEVDQTVDTILADIERELLPEIARALFPG